MRKKAFTLVELTTTLGIVSVLAVLLYPVMAHSRASNQKVRVMETSHELQLVAAMYSSDCDGVALSNGQPASELQQPASLVAGYWDGHRQTNRNLLTSDPRSLGVDRIELAMDLEPRVIAAFPEFGSIRKTVAYPAMAFSSSNSFGGETGTTQITCHYTCPNDGVLTTDKPPQCEYDGCTLNSGEDSRCPTGNPIYEGTTGNPPGCATGQSNQNLRVTIALLRAIQTGS